MEELRRAIEILRRGGLVAFPTETVYGLGADATKPGAVARIFAAKGRPPTNPLIGHAADAATVRRYAATWPPAAEALAAAFWPGPLTLVVRKTPDVVDAATAGRATVGLRVPDHPVALALLREFGGLVAAPSANRSNRVSPTTAAHVRAELGEAVDCILDGGPCRIGIESTVVDVSGDRPMLLRPGGVSRSQIEAIIGAIQSGPPTASPSASASSPGQHAVHYAPRTPAFRFDLGDALLAALRDLSRFGLLSPGGTDLEREFKAVIALPADPAGYARGFYAALRALDEMDLERIYVQMPPNTPEWLALRDRIMRATRPIAEAAAAQ